MAEIALTVSDVTTFDRVAGELVVVGDWTTGFDHAALVAAKRSRADHKDLWLYHTTAGYVPIVSVTGANTSTCKISFNLAADISGSMGDNRYRLRFGDLGKNFQTTTSAGTGSGGAVAVTAGSVPALALPTPGFDLTEDTEYGVRAFSTGLQTRTATLHEHAGQRLRAQWRNASGETAYEIRALVESVKGAGTFTFSGFTYRLVPGSLELEQVTAVSWNVALLMENVQL